MHVTCDIHTCMHCMLAWMCVYVCVSAARIVCMSVLPTVNDNCMCVVGGVGTAHLGGGGMLAPRAQRAAGQRSRVHLR